MSPFNRLAQVLSSNRTKRSLSQRALAIESLECRQLMTVVPMTVQEQLLIELVNRMRANPTAEAARYEIDLNKDLEPDEI